LLDSQHKPLAKLLKGVKWLHYSSSMGVRANAQLETQLLAEWLTASGWSSRSKTHVNVGAATLEYLGQRLSPARQRAFGVWNDWADCRIFTGSEVWLVEAKIVNVGGVYGQLLDYMDEYPSSSDYGAFRPAPIRGVVLCAFKRDRTANLFNQYGITTIVYTPVWGGDTLANKVFAYGPMR